MSAPVLDLALILVLPWSPRSPLLSLSLLLLLLLLSLLFFSQGGIAWSLSSSGSPRRRPIPGPAGIFASFSSATAHQILSSLARSLEALELMAFSVGFTRFVVSSRPDTAKEILSSPAFADRPIKESAYELLFSRAIGFAPFGEYWRSLRRISNGCLFSPKRVQAFGGLRALIGLQMVDEMKGLMERDGAVTVKKVLHFGSLNNVMMTVFGRRFDFGEPGEELEEMVREGYELLAVCNWSDHLPLLGWLDLQGVRRRCKGLVKRVDVFVKGIIDDHRRKRAAAPAAAAAAGDFVDVLLDLEEDEKLSDSDMVAVLWEMIFRGTDTVAILLEWIIARMVLHPEIQSKVQSEIDAATSHDTRPVSDLDIPSLPYLQAVVKECLRLHPPGPLLSWARLAIHDVEIGPHFIPAGTTAMVNMWSITHDEKVWPEPEKFKPERFIAEDVSILGSDLRLAPFGSGRRVCPGKALGLATVHLWLAQLLQSFVFVPASEIDGVDLSECLKMSMEMKTPLICKAISRR